MISNSLLALALLFGLAPADETHTIKSKKSAKGDMTLIEDQEEGENKLVLTVGGKEVPTPQGMGKEGKNEVYVETILEKPEKADRATSLKRKYEKARATKEGKETTYVYEGKTVLIDKKGDKFQFQLEGGKELTGKDAEALDKEFNKKDGLSEDEMEKLILPTKPVKVGDTWKIDAEKLFKGANSEIGVTGEGAKGTGKLIEVYEKNGHKFGKMDIDLEAPITKFGDEKVKFKVAEGSKLKMVFHVDVCIDGTSGDGTMKGDMAMDVEGTFDANGMEAKMVLHAKNKTTKKGTDQTKK